MCSDSRGFEWPTCFHFLVQGNCVWVASRPVAKRLPSGFHGLAIAKMIWLDMDAVQDCIERLVKSDLPIKPEQLAAWEFGKHAYTKSGGILGHCILHQLLSN